MKSSQSQIQTNYLFLVGSSLVSLFTIALIAIYFYKLQAKTPPILYILILLLINQFFESIFEMLHYIQGIGNVLCMVSLIGKTAFSLSANFWVIFITYLIYKQRVTPGKNVDIVKFISTKIILTFIPSIIVSVFLLVVVNVSETESEENCWRILESRQILDYVIYFTAFIIPNVIAMGIIIRLMGSYLLVRVKGHSQFLMFPILCVVCSAYYISIKLYLFINEKEITENLQIPFVIEPLLYGLGFIYIYLQMGKARTTSSDFTIKEELTIKEEDSNKESFFDEV